MAAMAKPPPSVLRVEELPDVCPSCGVALPDKGHIVDWADRQNRALKDPPWEK